MKPFKELRESYLIEALSRSINDRDVDKQFKSMRDPEGFYGDLDKARADMKKAYHPGNSARPKVWTSLAYPVRDGDYYFAFIDKSQKTNMKYNQKMNDALKQAFKGGDKKSEDDMWAVVSRELRTYPRSLGWNDTMTREELWGAIQHMLGKIREDVSEVAGIMTPAGIKKGKRKMAPKYLKNSVNESILMAEEVKEIDTILEKAYDANDVKKVQALEKKLKAMLKEVDKTMRGSGISAPAFSMVRGGVRKSLESIEKFYKIANTHPSYRENVNEKYRSKFPSSLVAAAVKIAIDMSGNMTGAYKKIEKMKRGLADDPMVADALKQANESVNEGVAIDQILNT